LTHHLITHTIDSPNSNQLSRNRKYWTS